MIFISRLPKKDDWVDKNRRNINKARELVKNSLFNENILRQGWGYPGYDLHQNKADWIKNAMAYPLGRSHQCTSTPKGAEKRYSILRPMLDVKPGDIIIIPYISHSSLLDRNIYTITVVKDKYHFENRSSFPDEYERDFGHCIPVKKIQCIQQSTFHINFQAYQKAFNRVHSHYIYAGISKL